MCRDAAEPERAVLAARLATSVPEEEEKEEVPSFTLLTKWLWEEKREVWLLIVSTRWFFRDWEDINSGAKYQTGLEASAFIIGFPGKAKQSDNTENSKS